MEDIQWLTEIMDKWQEEATDYPSQALFEALKDLANRQQQLLDYQKARLDGSMWQRNNWK